MIKELIESAKGLNYVPAKEELASIENVMRKFEVLGSPIFIKKAK